MTTRSDEVGRFLPLAFLSSDPVGSYGIRRAVLLTIERH